MGQLILATLLGFTLWKLWGEHNRGRMSPRDARALLDVDEGADAAAVERAYRRLIARVHPDVGGSKELAQRVNVARDTLLGELSRRA